MSDTKLFKAKKDKDLSKNSRQSPTTKQFAGYYSNKCLRSKTLQVTMIWNPFWSRIQDFLKILHKGFIRLINHLIAIKPNYEDW